MISQALHNRNTELKIHVLLHCKNLHSSIHSSPDRTFTLFSVGSNFLSLPLQTSHPILFFFRCQSLHTRPFSRSSFLYKPVSFQISSSPNSPPSLINAASHSLHQSRHHLPAIPSQTTRSLLPHASHAQSKQTPPLKKIRSVAFINEAAGLVPISHSGIHTKCTIPGQICAVTPCSVTLYYLSFNFKTLNI
jgi:hypothetical protein